MSLLATSVGSVLSGCNDAQGDADVDGGSSDTTTSEGTTSGTASGSDPSGAPTSAVDTTSADTSTSATTTDTGDDGPPPLNCPARDMFERLDPCAPPSPVDTFEPVVEWSWAGDGEFIYSIATPLVGNVTDDNGDGSIDLCDVPDVIVTVYRMEGCCGAAEAYIYALDGATGTFHWRSEVDVGGVGMTPALGDLDGDGVPEIVAVRPGGNIVAFDADGSVDWENAVTIVDPTHTVALADLDNSGEPEIIVSDLMFRSDGTFINGEILAGSGSYETSVAVDLDDDQDLEVLKCSGAIHHDGSILFTTPYGYGHVAVADLDGDPEPEIVCGAQGRVAVLEADGELVYEIVENGSWGIPPVIHDLDGDGERDFGLGHQLEFRTFHADGSPLWTAMVEDPSTLAGASAFDLLGDGAADVLYADQFSVWVFAGANGDVMVQLPQSSETFVEYPVVADVDTDGSAEIVVVNNAWPNEENEPIQDAPTVRVFGDARSRWMPARRIWNQHGYHVTNVNEDSTIPQFETPHWRGLNTFRAQAQTDAEGDVCRPVPPG